MPAVLRNGSPSITLRQLRIFAAVSRERSFARAAEGLYLSQPAVSAQVKELEHLLGVKLLVRSPGRNRVDLTEAGQILLSACEDVSQALARAERALEAVRGLDRGSVAFGAELCFGAYILPRVHHAFRQLYSGISVAHEVGHGHDLLESLRQHRLDLAVVVGPVEDAAFATEPLGGYDVILVGQTGHRLEYGRPAPFAELASEQFILPKDPFILRRRIDQMAARASISLQVAMEVNNIEAKVQAVADGVGIAPIGSYGAAAGMAAGQLAPLRVRGFPIRMDWLLVYRAGELSPGAEAYRSHLLGYRPMLEGDRWQPAADPRPAAPRR